MDMRGTAAPIKTNKAVSNLPIRFTDIVDRKEPTNQTEYGISASSLIGAYIRGGLRRRPKGTSAKRSKAKSSKMVLLMLRECIRWFKCQVRLTVVFLTAEATQVVT